MKLLIVGRTASGKDTLADILTKKYGYTKVRSYATRPQRDGESDKNHIFIDAAEAAQIKQDFEIAAWTQIGDYEYFTTMKQIEDCDIYVIDPMGVKELTRNMEDESFLIARVTVDEETRKKRFLSRDGSTEEDFLRRHEAENEQFEEFESKLASDDDDSIWKNNIGNIITVTNNEPEDLEKAAEFLHIILTSHRNLKRICLKLLLETDIINADNKLCPIIELANGTPFPISIDIFAMLLLQESQTENKNYLLNAFLALPDAFKNPKEG